VATGIAVPGDTRLLLGQGTLGNLSLGEALDHIGRGHPGTYAGPSVVA
jgi:hypothetical protein